MAVSDKLGALAHLGWVWNHGPFWAGIIALAFSWGGMNLVALVLEKRVLWPREQFASFYFGEFLLSAVIGLIAAMATDLHGSWYRASWFQLVALALAIAHGAGQVGWEIKIGQYTKDQFLSPTKLFHNFVLIPVMGYWIWSGGLAVLISADGHIDAKVATGLLILGWIGLVVYDALNPKIKAHVHYVWLTIQAMALGLGA